MNVTQVTVDRRYRERTDVELWVDVDLDGAVRVHRATDLSLGGLSLERGVPHATGSRVTLELRLPDRGAALRIEAEVMGADRNRGVGLRFVSLTREQRVRLADFLLRCWA